MIMRKTVITLTLAMIAGVAHAQGPMPNKDEFPMNSPTRPPVNAGDKNWMWVSPDAPPRRDLAKEGVDNFFKPNPFAFDPKKPHTYVYVVAAPVIAATAGAYLINPVVTGIESGSIALVTIF